MQVQISAGYKVEGFLGRESEIDFYQEIKQMKESMYKNYDELPLFLNAETVAKVLGVSPSMGGTQGEPYIFDKVNKSIVAHFRWKRIDPALRKGILFICFPLQTGGKPIRNYLAISFVFSDICH